MEAGGKPNLAHGAAARAGMRLSYGLGALVLGLASSAVTHAAAVASEERLGIDPLGLGKTEGSEVSKPAPADLPTLIFEGLDEFPVQQPATNAGSELMTAGLPEVPLLAGENWVTEAVELMPETSEVSAPDRPTSPARPAASPVAEITFGFSDAAPLAVAVITDLTPPPSFGDGTVAVPGSEGIFAGGTAIAQVTDATADIPWRFNFEPFFYVPFGANGDITVRGISAPIDAGIGDIFDAIVNDLNFAAFGRVEGWKGPWGIFFSGAYMNLGTGRTADIPVPPVLQQAGLPSQFPLDAAVGTSFTQLDLGGAYRFGDGNLPTALRTANTEFDLGPFVFDAMAGLRLYSFNNDLVLTGPRGNQFEFEQSRTVLEPMIGGRARWNLSSNLAAVAGGTMSGFSLGDLTFSVAGYGGIDWLFSGNTSLTASYGFTYLDYSSGNSGLDLFTHGPNIGVKFRF
jgi:hypothetical protein